MAHSEQPSYQTVLEQTYWSLLVTFNKWNIIKFTNKTKSSEEFDEAHKVVLDGINANMASLL